MRSQLGSAPGVKEGEPYEKWDLASGGVGPGFGPGFGGPGFGGPGFGGPGFGGPPQTVAHWWVWNGSSFLVFNPPFDKVHHNQTYLLVTDINHPTLPWGALGWSRLRWWLRFYD